MDKTNNNYYRILISFMNGMNLDQIPWLDHEIAVGVEFLEKLPSLYHRGGR